MASSRHEELSKGFRVYDETVDIVSCWEAVLKHSFDPEYQESPDSEFENFYFDRFPSIPQENDNPLTPDFTVFFNEKYGIIGEIKRTFPDGDEEFRSTIEDILSYDAELPIKNSLGDRIVPNICDLVVIIKGIDAPQIGTRLQRILVANEEYEFENPPVLLRYHFDQTTTASRYDFQRVNELEFEFRDDPIPTDDSFSGKMGQEGDYGTLKVIPKYFAPEKIKKPLCNDDPPGAYLSTILWHKIFPEYLSRDEYLKWQMGTGQKIIPFEDSVEGFTQRLNEYIHDGSARMEWVREALDFLCGAGLAEEIGEDEYRIGFRGLVRDVGGGHLDENAEFLARIRELGTTIINRYCEYEGDSTISPSQTSIEDFDED